MVIEKAYKVFYYSKIGETLWSVNIALNKTGLHQQYFRQVKNFPFFDYPIMAFGSIVNAYAFIHAYHSILTIENCQVYEISGEYAEIAGVLDASIIENKIDDLTLDVWKGNRVIPPPPGTIGLSHLKFKKIIPFPKFKMNNL